MKQPDEHPGIDQEILANTVVEAIKKVDGVVTILTPPTLSSAWNSALDSSPNPVRVKLPNLFKGKIEVDIFIEVNPKIPASEVGYQVQLAADHSLKDILPAESLFSVNVHILRIAKDGFDF